MGRGKSECDIFHPNTERMCFVKKILALMVLAGFLVVGVVGCGGSPTSKPASPTTGSPPKPADK